ncbi:MAG: hypothetical protein OXU96_02350, partial [Gammaproteobacteria bacterium]|nr:hypothetical protein [Gammaproteobacteria bacterium]
MALPILVACPTLAPAQQTPDATHNYIFQEAATLADYRKPEGSSFTVTVRRRTALTGAQAERTFCAVFPAGAELSAADFRASETATTPATAYPAAGPQFVFNASNWNTWRQCMPMLHTFDDHRPEPQESISVVLWHCQSGNCADNRNTVIRGQMSIQVTDNDIANSISIRATNSGGDRDTNAPGLQVHEGDTVTWQILVHTALTTSFVDVTFNLGGTYGTADSSTGPFTRPFTIAIGLSGDSNDGIHSFDQTITDDSAIENAETIVFSVVSATDAGNIAPGGWRLPAPVTVTIP